MSSQVSHINKMITCFGSPLEYLLLHVQFGAICSAIYTFNDSPSLYETGAQPLA